MTVILLLLLPTPNKIHSLTEQQKEAKLSFFSLSSISISTSFRNVCYLSCALRVILLQRKLSVRAGLPQRFPCNSAASRLPERAQRPPETPPACRMLRFETPPLAPPGWPQPAPTHVTALPIVKLCTNPAQTQPPALRSHGQGTDPTAPSHPLL